MNIQIKPLNEHNENILWMMLFEAAHLEEENQTIEYAKSNPDLAKYVEDWGQKGDEGYYASINGKPAGAIWMRLFSKEKPGYGFIDEKTPELAIALYKEYRNQGIGTLLMNELIAKAQIKYRTLSLSTRLDNLPALRLYKKYGFHLLEGTEITNRVGKTSATMLLNLNRL